MPDIYLSKPLLSPLNVYMVHKTIFSTGGGVLGRVLIP